MKKILICITAIGLTLYGIIYQQNQLTELRLKIPQLAKELRMTQEENTRLTYAIESFESPIHLIELSRKPEFGSLKYPPLNEVTVIHQTSTTTSSHEVKAK